MMAPNETSERALREKAFDEAMAKLWPSRRAPAGPIYKAVKERVLAGEITPDQAAQIIMTQHAGRIPMNHADFGAWAGQCEDGLAYQERMREEW